MFLFSCCIDSIVAIKLLHHKADLIICTLIMQKELFQQILIMRSITVIKNSQIYIFTSYILSTVSGEEF